MKSAKIFTSFFMLMTLFASLTSVSPAQADMSQIPLAANGDLMWAKGIGGTSSDIGTSVTTDFNNNVYMVGYFLSTAADFDPGIGTVNLTSNGGSDGFITKFDKNGSLVWAKNIGGTAYDSALDIVLDTSNNIYVTGYFQGTVDFDPGLGVSNITSNGMDDTFILKLDNDGNFIWAKRIGGTSIDNGIKISLDSSGNIYILSQFWGTSDHDPSASTFNLVSAGMGDISITKLDSSGNLVWAKGIGGASDDYGNSFAISSTGNIDITGNFEGTADFNPGVETANLTSNGSYDIFASALDQNGQFLWARNIGGIGNDDGVDIELGSSDSIYISGIFGGTVDFDPGTGVSQIVGTGLDDIYALKLDSNGNYVWVIAVGGSGVDFSNDIEIDNSENIYISGAFSGSVDFDPFAGVTYLVSNGYSDIFVAKYDSSGHFVLGKSMGGTSADSPYGLTLDTDSNILLTGRFQDIADFDPGAGALNLTSVGLSDIFLAKLEGDIAGDVLYAIPNGLTSGSCKSWGTACTLQTALTNATNGDEIWVASGTHKPTTGSDQFISFVIKNGVSIYGGFFGSETQRDQRNPAVNITTLSGDIGTTGDASDNSLNVITGSGVGSSTILDGLTISSGHASLSVPPYNGGGGMNLINSSPSISNVKFLGNYGTYGGGMHTNNSSPTLTNVLFKENTASEAGAIYSENSSNLTFNNVTFELNYSYSDKGTVVNKNSTSNIQNSIFTNNSSGGWAGGIFNDNSETTINNTTFKENSGAAGGAISNNNNSTLTITNSTFDSNNSTDGGAIYNGLSYINISNSTFYNNDATYPNAPNGNGGAIFNSFGEVILTNVTIAENSAEGVPAIANTGNLGIVTIKNSILWGNTGNAPQLYNLLSGSISATYSIIEGGFTGTGNLSVNPLLSALGNNGGFTKTFSLGVGSPAINAGDDNACSAAPVNNTSQNGVTRPQGAHCDIGAFESENIPPSITSITRTSTSPTSALSVNFTINFSEAVQNVGVGDFTLTTTGVASATITGVTPVSASVYTISVNTGSESGTIRLDVPNTASIKDLSNNDLSGLPFTSGETYTIDKSGGSLPTSATFGDVPMNHPYWEDIEILYANGLTAGCSTTLPLLFCPDVTMNRAQSAVFMVRGNFGTSYTPPAAPWTTFGDDFSPGTWAQPWAQGMFDAGLTAGCSNSPRLFCPWEEMPRFQAAVFGMRLRYGNSYPPPAGTGTVFADINGSEWYAGWAEQAYSEGLLPACGSSGGKPLFCPNDLVPRGLAAYMIVRAKNLSMP